MQSSQSNQPESSHHRVSNVVDEDSDLRIRESLNGSDGVGPGGNSKCPRCAHYEELKVMERFNQMWLGQNDGVNRSYGYVANGGMINNGSLNGVSSSSRNRVLDQTPWYSIDGLETGRNTSWRGNEGFDYNNVQGLSMKNRRGRPSILSMARDQELTQHVKKSIVEGSEETVDMIFDCLIDHVCDLMMDPFGNDVVKTLMHRCSSEQITQIVDMVVKYKSQFVNICFHPLGSQAIQSLLGQMKIRCQEDQILRIVAAISVVALRLTRSTNANYVILTCFREFTFSQFRILLEVVARNFYQIAIDQHGCCMLQQCFDKRRIQHPEIKQCLYIEIFSHALKLCLNRYGNYVVQSVVVLADHRIKKAVVQKLAGSYAHLARDKFGSHAVQKLLELGGYVSSFIVRDLLTEIDTLLVDPFGNYVIQTAWLVSLDPDRYVLWGHIERNIGLMRCNKYGIKILEKLNL